MTDIENQLEVYYRDYGYCPIGIEFCDPDIIKSLADVVRTGRADTIKEAINVLLDDAHKTTMEMEARFTSQAAGTTAAFSAASFFFK